MSHTAEPKARLPTFSWYAPLIHLKLRQTFGSASPNSSSTTPFIEALDKLAGTEIMI